MVLKKLLGGVVLGAFLIGSLAPSNVIADTYTDPNFYTETVAAGLSVATAMDFAPDGSALIAEKAGAIRVVDRFGNLLAEPFYTVPNVNNANDRGVIGLAIDPDFATNGYVYIAHTYENNPSDPNGKKTARVIRVTSEASWTKAVAGSQITILGTVGGTAAQPSCYDYGLETDCILSDSLSHSIGGLRFGVDGKLYVSTGDGAGFDVADPNAFVSQDLISLSGKVLRINTDGTGPSDNPFYTGDPHDNTSKIYANGFRNPYRFNFRPGTLDLFVADVGWYTREEVNFVLPGQNYGWPCREGIIANPDSAYADDPICAANAPFAEPIHDYPHVGVIGAVTGGAFAQSNEYPEEFRGAYIFGDFTLGFMKALTFFSGSGVETVINMADDVAGPVEFVTGPDDLVYYLSIFSGELRRIRYTDTSQVQDPTAVIIANPAAGPVPLTVEFNGTNSFDVNGEAIVGYDWDFGDGGTSDNEQPTHIFQVAGVYDVQLTVTNDIGETGTAFKTITVGDPQGPVADVVHVSSSKSPDVNYAGAFVDFSTTLRNDGEADDVRVQLIVRNASGVQVGSEEFNPTNFAAGEERQFGYSWFPPTVGDYSYWVGVQTVDGTQDILPLQKVLDITVENRTPDPDPDPDPSAEIVHVSSSKSPDENYVGDFVDFTTTLRNDGDADITNVQLIVRDAGGSHVGLQEYDFELFGAGEERQFEYSWFAPLAGDYTYWVGVQTANGAQDILPLQNVLGVSILERPSEEFPDISFERIQAPLVVEEGRRARIRAWFTNNESEDIDASIRLVIRDVNGDIVKERVFLSRQFDAGETRRFRLSWRARVPAGLYYVDTYVSSPDLQDVYEHRAGVAQILVVD